MKLYIVISDTHSALNKAGKAIAQYPQADGVIHLGDYCKDARILQSRFPDMNFIIVPGNCDYAADLPDERVLEIEEKRILITHGHRYGVKYGMSGLKSKAEKENLDAVLFGHTHIPMLDNSSGVLYLNPGSMGYPRGSNDPTWALLEVSGRRMEARIMDARL